MFCKTFKTARENLFQKITNKYANFTDYVIHEKLNFIMRGKIPT